MPDLDHNSRDIEPAVRRLRLAADVIPWLVGIYFVLQFATVGYWFGVGWGLVGAGLGLLLAYVVSQVVVSVFIWMIHVLFLLHGLREQKGSETES